MKGKLKKTMAIILSAFLLAGMMQAVEVYASVNVVRSMTGRTMNYQRSFISVAPRAHYGVNGLRTQIENRNNGARSTFGERAQLNNIPTNVTVQSGQLRIGYGHTARGHFMYRRQIDGQWRTTFVIDQVRPLPPPRP